MVTRKGGVAPRPAVSVSMRRAALAAGRSPSGLLRVVQGSWATADVSKRIQEFEAEVEMLIRPPPRRY
jgi:hypothetical protein